MEMPITKVPQYATKKEVDNIIKKAFQGILEKINYINTNIITKNDLRIFETNLSSKTDGLMIEIRGLKSAIKELRGKIKEKYLIS